MLQASALIRAAPGRLPGDPTLSNRDHQLWIRPAIRDAHPLPIGE
jgi:hypothetical protein